MEADRPRRSRQSSPWAWIGCGCGLLVMLALAGVTSLTWTAYRQGKRMEEAQKDPAVREALVREVLPYDELPVGYQAVGSFSIPMLVQIAMLSDQPPEVGSDGNAEPRFGERGFLFLKMNGWTGRQKDLERFVLGQGERPGWLGGAGADADVGEVLRRGRVQAGGREILYMATRGEVHLQKGHEARDAEGLVTWLSVDCPADRRARLGLWFGPDPAPGKPLQEADLAGTTADPGEIQQFAGHFRFCG